MNPIVVHKDNDGQGQRWDPRQRTGMTTRPSTLSAVSFFFHYIFILLMCLLKGTTSLNNNKRRCPNGDNTSSTSITHHHFKISTCVQNDFNHYDKHCGRLLWARDIYVSRAINVRFFFHFHFTLMIIYC